MKIDVSLDIIGHNYKKSDKTYKQTEPLEPELLALKDGPSITKCAPGTFI